MGEKIFSGWTAVGSTSGNSSVGASIVMVRVSRSRNVPVMVAVTEPTALEIFRLPSMPVW